MTQDDFTNGDHADLGIEVRPVQAAYEQIADQLTDLIVTGALGPNHRLPSEESLSASFSVSRATVREALRALSAQGLIRTTRGASGGSFVARQTAAEISSRLDSSFHLLAQGREVSLDDFLEARELLEVPAARLAAMRGTQEDLAQLRAAVPSDPMQQDVQEQFTHNRDFHSLLVKASRNMLLLVAAQPIFTVLQANLQRSQLDEEFLEGINRDHRAILAALEEGDGDRVSQEMHAHFAFLRPTYKRIWVYR